MRSGPSALPPGPLPETGKKSEVCTLFDCHFTVFQVVWGCLVSFRLSVLSIMASSETFNVKKEKNQDFSNFPGAIL